MMGAKQLLDQETRNRIRFNWQLIGANLVSGQGTRKVVFNPLRSDTSVSSSVKLKLAIENAPPELPVEPTCTVNVDFECAAPQIVDQYSGIQDDEERAHLDRVGNFLTPKGSRMIAYIVSYMGRKACIWEAEWRAKRAKKYLIEKYRVAPERIVDVDGGVREHWGVEIFVQSEGTCGPTPTPIVARDEVIMRGECPDWVNVFRREPTPIQK